MQSNCLLFQGTASEATLVALLSAKARAVEKFKNGNKEGNLSEFKSKLVAYASCQAHSSVERAGLLADVTMRLLEPDKDLSLRGKTLAKVNANSLMLLTSLILSKSELIFCRPSQKTSQKDWCLFS